MSPEDLARRRDQMAEWGDCMRARGHDIPDPQVDANGNVTVRGDSSRNPTTKADMRACSKAAGIKA